MAKTKQQNEPETANEQVPEQKQEEAQAAPAVVTAAEPITRFGTRAELMTQFSNNKSAVIRHLTSKGMKRGEVAKLLNIKYQFVRNVLMQQPKKGGSANAATEQPASSTEAA